MIDSSQKFVNNLNGFTGHVIQQAQSAPSTGATE